MSDSLRPHGLYSPWNSPGQNTEVGSLSLIQGIFPIQGSNLGLPLCRQILYKLSHKGSPGILDWVVYPFSTESSRPRNQACIAGGFFTNWAITSPSPPAFNLSQHQGPNESVLRIKWPKCWSFSFSISPSNEYAGLISFRIDWLDLLARTSPWRRNSCYHHFTDVETEARGGEVMYPSKGTGIWTWAAWLQSLSSEALYYTVS